MARRRDELQAENEQLRQRVAELEQERDEARTDRQWMEDLLEQSNVPICLWRGDELIYTFANTAYLQRTGKFDAIGKPLRAVFEEHEVPGLMDLVERAYTSGERQVISEARVSFENPETGQTEDFWYNLIFNPVRNAQNKVVGASNFAVEITEQVRARQELYQQAQILNQVRGSVVVTDMQGTIISWNRDSLRIYGYTPEEIIGQPIAQLYPSEEQERLINEVIIPLQERGELEIETIAYNKNGNAFPIQLSLSLLRDDSGTPVGMIGHSIDISERKRQEEELRMFKTTVENAPDGISFVSPDGIITYGNPAMRALLEYGDDYIGLPVPTVFGGDAEAPMQIIQEVIGHGFWSGLQTYYRKDGSTLPVHVSVFAIRDEQEHIVSFPGFVRDMTEVQQAEAERAALQQQVIEAQRATLRELSAPLLPISARVVIMPLIGTIDSQRAQQVMETLLEGVATHRADTAIIDITGVQVVDTQVANALVQAAQAARLLGAQVVLTGIGPAMAQTLVSLGVDLGDIITRGNLQGGIAYALRTPRGNGLKSGA